jgi:pyridoxal phosphate enzyme (YggS family)
MSTLRERLAGIEARIAKAAAEAGRSRADVTLVAVSKVQPLALVQEAFALGVRDFGENYAQELVEKAREVPGARWHFIGRLQKNKINMLKPFVAVWQTVDSVEAAQAIVLRVPAPPLMFLQVNIGKEPQKSGVDPDAAIAAVKAAPLSGLMCIPPAGDSEPHFRRMRELRDACEAAAARPLALSMGMSDDFELAIRLGATHVRVGTALFGARS